MKSKKLVLILFVVVALIQLFVPIKMILDREATIESGKEFKFRTQPIDPNDPFRGKYVRLNFDGTQWDVESGSLWERNQKAYVLLEEDSLGYAKVKDIIPTRPEDSSDYFETYIKYVYDYTENHYVTLDFPFNRYYMEESKALNAEKLVRRSGRQNKKEAYAVVFVKDGSAVLIDVMIDNESINDIVSKRMESSSDRETLETTEPLDLTEPNE